MNSNFADSPSLNAAESGQERGANAPRPRPWSGLAAAVLILSIAAANFAFIARDRADFGVKDANHFMDLAREILMRWDDGFDPADFAFDPGASSYARLYLPTNWILGALAMRLTAVSPLTLRLYSACFLPLALIYVYLLTRRFCGPWAALLAVFIGGTNSLALESSRHFTLDAPLSLMLAGALYHGAQSRGFARLWPGAAALAWAVFGMAIKPQFAAMALPPLALMAAIGWHELARGGKWKRLAATFGWQFGLAALALAAAYAIKPNLFHLAANARELLRQETYSFTLLNAPGADHPPAGAGVAYWLIGLIWSMRRMAWPLAALFFAGSILGPIRIRGAHDKAALIGIPLSMLCMNFALVWAGVHLEMERYLGPMFALFGAPVAAVFGTLQNARLRRMGLGALAAFALINTFGPSLAPHAFDAAPRPLFPSLRFDGFAHSNHPLINVKLWDEPPVRPQRNSAAAQIRDAVRSMRSSGADQPLRVAVVASSYYGNDSAPAYSWLNSDEALFAEAAAPEDLYGADMVLLVVPASPGGVGFAPARTIVRMTLEDYMSAAIALESDSLRERLGFSEGERLGLPNGRTLTIFRRVETPAPLEFAIFWYEMRVTHNTVAERLADAAQWLENGGHGEAAAVLRGAMEAPDDPIADDSARAYIRLKSWLRAMNNDTPPAEKAAALNEAMNASPAPAPGMRLASAVEALRFGHAESASAFVRANLDLHPLHVRTWATIPALVDYGLDFPVPLAQRGEALAREAFEESRLLREILARAREMALAGYPQFWERKQRLLELLHDDQTHDLRTPQIEATLRFVQGESGAETQKLLRTAIGLAGQPFTEEVDTELRAMLKDAEESNR